MSAIRSALEEWVNEELDLLSIDQPADDLVELEMVSGLLKAERLRRVSIFERRSGPGRFGYPSLTAFLKHRCRMASGRAHRLVSRSRLLGSARATVRAWTGGRVSTDQANVLLDLAGALPGPFAESASELVEIVEELGVSDTRRVIGYWRQSVDGPGTVRDELEQREMRGISTSTSLDGMLRLDGWMTPLAGQALVAALDALIRHLLLMTPALRASVDTTPWKTWHGASSIRVTPPRSAGRSRTSTSYAIYLRSKRSPAGSMRPKVVTC